MLSSILKQHQEQMKGRNETQEKLKKESVDAANELTQNLVSFKHLINYCIFIQLEFLIPIVIIIKSLYFSKHQGRAFKHSSCDCVHQSKAFRCRSKKSSCSGQQLQ